MMSINFFLRFKNLYPSLERPEKDLLHLFDNFFLNCSEDPNMADIHIERILAEAGIVQENTPESRKKIKETLIQKKKIITK